MKKTFNTFAITTVLLLSIGCKNYESIESLYQPNGTALKTLYTSNLESIKQTATFNVANGIHFTSSKGSHLRIMSNCITTQNDQPVTGNVDLTFIEIFDRGTMLVTNKPTVGIDAGERKLLTTGGEFFINVSQNGQALKAGCDFYLHAPTSLTGGTDPDMAQFEGNIDSNGDLTWEEFSQGGEFWIGFNNEVNADAYNTFMSAFGWYNYDKFVDLGNGFTNVTFTTPTGFNNTNSAIFIASKTFPNSLSYANARIPIGAEVYYILISEHNGGFKYIVKPLQTISANQNITFNLSEMQDATTIQMINIINNLP